MSKDNFSFIDEAFANAGSDITADSEWEFNVKKEAKTKQLLREGFKAAMLEHAVTFVRDKEYTVVSGEDGTKVPGAIVVTNDFTTKLTKKLDAHYYQLILSLVGNDEDELLEVSIIQNASISRNEFRAELRKKLNKRR